MIIKLIVILTILEYDNFIIMSIIIIIIIISMII